MIKQENCRILNGAIHEDERGTLKFFNEFEMGPVRRFYISEHPSTAIVKAWQAHRIESKWFHVIAGAFKVVLVKPDDWNKPSPDIAFEEFSLEERKNVILYIPGGYATGFQATLPASKIMVFSDATLDKSLDDDYRFDKDLWYKW